METKMMHETLLTVLLASSPTPKASQDMDSLNRDLLVVGREGPLFGKSGSNGEIAVERFLHSARAGDREWIAFFLVDAWDSAKGGEFDRYPVDRYAVNRYISWLNSADCERVNGTFARWRPKDPAIADQPGLFTLQLYCRGRTFTGDPGPFFMRIPIQAARARDSKQAAWFIRMWSGFPLFSKIPSSDVYPRDQN
ncbi:MAG: hypothetical protein ACT4TC_19585 [Myxococcaceae bacterium]